MPDWLAGSIAGLLGAVLGSFLNVCVHRWPIGE
jgi:prepilin signal peptidase PulO-like enzyme (type II secretory pathway)